MKSENREPIWVWVIVMFWATAALVATEFWRVDRGQTALFIAVGIGWFVIWVGFRQQGKREKEEEKEEQLREKLERLEQEGLTCKGCNQNMMEVDTCLCEYVVSRKDGKTYKRKKYKRDSTFSCQGGRCSKCNIVEASGNYHHIGCYDDVCPRCGSFVWSCDCDMEAVPPEVSYNREDS